MCFIKRGDDNEDGGFLDIKLPISTCHQKNLIIREKTCKGKESLHLVFFFCKDCPPFSQSLSSMIIYSLKRGKGDDSE